jgi:hypothetical protein
MFGAGKPAAFSIPSFSETKSQQELCQFGRGLNIFIQNLFFYCFKVAAAPPCRPASASHRKQEKVKSWTSVYLSALLEKNLASARAPGFLLRMRVSFAKIHKMDIAKPF